MRRRPLWIYVIGDIIALLIADSVAYLVGGPALLRTLELVSFGFLLGMFAMYIAMHLYRWK